MGNVKLKNRFAREFWVTNIARDRDVSLGDLRLTIRVGETRNLLDSRHYTYTLEQLQKSAESGSIKAKSQWIKVRDLPPKRAVRIGRYDLSKAARYAGPLRNKIDVEAPKFEELDFLDDKSVQEKFAADDAEIVHNDIQPALAVDKQFAKDKS